MCFLFTDTATTEIYTLSLHDALPIYGDIAPGARAHSAGRLNHVEQPMRPEHRIHTRLRHFARHRNSLDRKSTRLNSSHPSISYAVFCLKKKKKKKILSTI